MSHPEGLIPAHAGKTERAGDARHDHAAHPRSRGENAGVNSPILHASGSSPLTRGKPGFLTIDEVRARLIPAHAGKTCSPPPPSRSTRAHPRSRGENWRPSGSTPQRAGSSPLTRGKRAVCPPVLDRGRLIPAHAGKTFFSRFVPFLTRAHPRSRGENVRTRFFEGLYRGSSPLTRGKRALRSVKGLQGRLIPAHAGKTLLGLRRCSATWAHPRSRGENDQRAAARRDCGGSSPLTRGKLYEQGCEWADKRLIPAHAGKTRRAHDARRLRKAHPRSRGENP